MPPDTLPFDLLQYFTADDLARGAERAQVEGITLALEVLVDSLLLFALTFSRPGALLWERLRAFAQKKPPSALDRVLGPDWVAGALFLALTVLLRQLAGLPLGLACDFFHARRIGLSHESFASYLGHLAAVTLLAALVFALLGSVLAAVRRRWPRRWWLAVGGAGALALVGDAVVEPHWQRLHYTVSPLEQGALRDRIEQLARDQRASLGDIVTIDASRYGTRANAFVTGFGPSRRLVLTDTLLAWGDEAVVGAVGHELGHRREEKMPTRLALSAVGLLAFLWLVERALRLCLARGARSEAHALPAVIAVFALVLFALAPLQAARGRAEERDADRLELALRHDYDAYVAEQVRLARANATAPLPGPWAGVLADHPSPAERIGRALWYKGNLSRGQP